MTCIAGIENPDGTVLLGADSILMETKTMWKQALTEPKVFTNGPLAIGVSGDWRIGQIIHYVFTPPRLAADPDDDTLMRYFCSTFVDRLRACLSDAGVLSRNNDVEDFGKTEILVAARGRLFSIGGDFCVARSSTGYDAIGMAAPIALGVLHATTTQRLSPATRITRALEAAAAHNASVMAPFTLLTHG